MLRFGDKNISKLFLGDKAIAKAYLGDKLVFQGQPTFLDYIHFDGASYIDTGIPFGYVAVKYGAKYYETGTRQIMGFGSASGYWVSAEVDGKISYISGTNGFEYNDISYITYPNDETTFKRKFIVGEKSSGISTYNITTSGNFYIGCLSGNSYWLTADIYYFKVEDSDGNLLQDLRPCMDPKGVVCMYDMVTKKYFYNQGTGELKAGGRFVKSILFDGASWIDTGITQQTCTVECGIKFANADTRQLMGFHSSNAGYWGCRNASGRYEASGGLLNTTVSALDYNNVVIEYNCDDTAAPFVRVTVGDATAAVVGTAVFTTRNYTIGALLNSSADASYHMTGQVYYNKFYIGGELVQDLRPYVDENGVACFKDLVTNTLFYNQGTGTLTYTE